MSQDWLEKALDDVVDAIQKGARMPVDNRLREGLKERYRPSFKRHNEDLWKEVRSKILALAELVGSLGAVVTYLKAVDERRPMPREVDHEAAYYSGFLFKSTACVALTGVWCDLYAEERITGSEQLQRAEESLANFMNDVGFVLRRS